MTVENKKKQANKYLKGITSLESFNKSQTISTNTANKGVVEYG